MLYLLTSALGDHLQPLHLLPQLGCQLVSDVVNNKNYTEKLF